MSSSGQTISDWPPRPLPPYCRPFGPFVAFHSTPYPPGSVRGPVTGVSRHRHPVSRHDLLAFPFAAVQVQVSELRDVARIEVAVAPSVAAPLRVIAPDDVLDVERIEQVLAAEVELAGLRRRPDHGAEQMVARTAVGRPGAAVVLHRQRQGECHPIGRSLHPLQFLLTGQEAAVQSRLHAQQVLHRDRALALVGVGRALLRKEREHGLVETKHLAGDRDASQRRGDGLRHRRDVVRYGRSIRIEVRVGDDESVTDDEQAVGAPLLLADLGDRRGQRL